MERPSDDFVEAVVEAFDYPEAPLQTVAVYGSGAFTQASYAEGAQPMVDFIFAVDNPEDWHEANILARQADYSKKGLVKATRQRLQRVGGALWYHPYVDFQGREIKYGLIGSGDLETDCQTWDRLYAAGRLQKPTNLVRSTAKFDQAQALNVDMANRVALLLGDRFRTELGHYESIAGISYIGDPRMILHLENPEKVGNIVRGNEAGFHEMHGPHLEALQRDGYVAKLGALSDQYEVTDDPEHIRQIAQGLPYKLPDNPVRIPRVLRRKIWITVLGTGIRQPLKANATTSAEGRARYLEEKRAKSKRA